MEEILIFFALGCVIASFWFGYFSQKIYRWILGKRLGRSKKLESVWTNLSSEQIQSLVKLLGKQKTGAMESVLGKNLVFSSQYGEDIFLSEFFKFKRQGFFVEIGAYDGIFLSNTYLFEQLGWTGILVEPLPEKYRECVLNRPSSQVINAVVGNSSEKTAEITHVIGTYPTTRETLSTHSFVNVSSNIKVENKISGLKEIGANFEKFTVPMLLFDEIAVTCGLSAETSIDFISIDCEGMDFEVLKSINLHIWHPEIFIIEVNDHKIFEYLEKFGYIPVLSTLGNIIFAHKSLDDNDFTKNRFWQAMLGRFKNINN